MTQAGKVAEIFSVAGEAFTQLGNLAMCLQPASTQDGGKWDDEEIDMLRKAVAQFGNDIEKISEKIKTKSTTQIKNTLKGKTVHNLNGTPRGRNSMKQTQKTPPMSADVGAHGPTPVQNNIMETLTPIATHGLLHQSINSSAKMQIPAAATHVTIASAPAHHATTPTNHATPTVVYVTTVPPGLKPIAAKPLVTPSMKPTIVTFQGQNIVVKSDGMGDLIAHPMASAPQQTLSIKSTGGATPASIITSQLNKSPMKIINMPRTLGQKAKLENVSGMMSLADAGMMSLTDMNKKVKVDPSNLNILTSTLLSQKPLIRSQTSGIPGVVSSQGFQVIMPASSKNIYPVTVRPTLGVVQRVADITPTTNGNVDATES